MDGLLARLVRSLTDSGFVTHHLTSPEDVHGSHGKFMGTCRLLDRPAARHRRLDLIATPWVEWGAALLYFTGSAHFNRSMRLLASTIAALTALELLELSFCVFSIWELSLPLACCYREKRLVAQRERTLCRCHTDKVKRKSVSRVCSRFGYGEGHLRPSWACVSSSERTACLVRLPRSTFRRFLPGRMVVRPLPKGSSLGRVRLLIISVITAPAPELFGVHSCFANLLVHGCQSLTAGQYAFATSGPREAWRVAATGKPCGRSRGEDGIQQFNSSLLL